MTGKFLSRSEAETIELGRKFAQVLIPGDVVALYGDIGSGKTRFVKGVCLGLGVNETVNSPTFIIMNLYSGRIPVYHFDFYRVKDLDEIIEIGFDEFIYDDGVSLIEWADFVREILPDKRYDVFIKFGEGETEREIEIRRL